MEIRHLRHFVVVAEEEHFGRASRRLSIVQPALTRQIHDLEQDLGVPLFGRSGRNVRLTNAGRVFLEEARRLLAELDRAKYRTQLAARGQTGTLTVAFVNGMTDTPLLPTVLAEFRGAVPDVALDLRGLRSHEQEVALRNHEINIGFCYFLPPDLPTLQSQYVSTTRILLAVPKGHRLERKARVFLRDLRDEPFVWFPRGAIPTYHDRIAHACHNAGLSMRVVSEAAQEPMLLGLVAAGVGVTFALDRGHGHYNCVFRKVHDLHVENKAYAIWRGDDPSPILPRFLAVLRSVLTRLTPVTSRKAPVPRRAI
jgi:DNA-binding transcriptional LysR family regulator